MLLRSVLLEKPFLKKEKKTLWLIFMDWVQLSQGYTAFTKWQFT